jgi:hypothetical protein
MILKFQIPNFKFQNPNSIRGAAERREAKSKIPNSTKQNSKFQIVNPKSFSTFTKKSN